QPDAGDDPEITARNTRYGLILFTVYLVIYGAYVLANAFAPTIMENTIAGVTLAILSGFGLIIAAFVLALIYGWLCRATKDSSHRKDAPQ
ncbi:MAG: DUF485 domain-containing protein, partial [Planctomycetaceae bacterium]|nr:DUF485 domain-containing protein [Planctomycetaceae bacterium]